MSFNAYLLDEYLRAFNGGREPSPEQSETAARMKKALEDVLATALEDQRKAIADSVAAMAETWTRAGFPEQGSAIRVVAKHIRNGESST